MLIFVYGTLKRGHRNFHLLANSKFVGQAITNTKYKMLDAGFPVLLGLTKDDKEGSGHFVEGEVYDVDAATAKRLDQLEGEGHMYNRVRKYVKMGEGSVRLHYYVGVPAYWDRYLDEDRPHFHTPINGKLNWPEGRPTADAA